MGSAATFLLAVTGLTVVVVGMAYLQISWRTSGASLRFERHLASLRRGLGRSRDHWPDPEDVDYETHAPVERPSALIDEAV